jgi:hypothetical protein
MPRFVFFVKVKKENRNLFFYQNQTKKKLINLNNLLEKNLPNDKLSEEASSRTTTQKKGVLNFHETRNTNSKL